MEALEDHVTITCTLLCISELSGRLWRASKRKIIVLCQCQEMFGLLYHAADTFLFGMFLMLQCGAVGEHQFLSDPLSVVTLDFEKDSLCKKKDKGEQREGQREFTCEEV